MPRLDPVPLDTITGGETLLILTARPGDETALCGGLIAACCRRGRPPFVMVLGDGSSVPLPGADVTANDLARRRDRETRAAVACLGLDTDYLLMAGLYDGSIPGEGPRFEAIVRAVTLVMWRQDCNVIVAPWPRPGAPDGVREVDRVAAAVSAASGVGRVAFAPDAAGADVLWFDGGAVSAAKRAAAAAHASTPGVEDLRFESFVLGGMVG